jgi:hypothetical protein
MENRMRRIFPALVMLLAVTFLLEPLAAQQLVTLTAAKLSDLSGNLVTGQLCLSPVDNYGTQTGFLFGGGGQAGTQANCGTVTAGAVTMPVPDTAFTNPVNVCVKAQLMVGSRAVRTWPCLQPASSGQTSWCTTVGSVTTCNLDNYLPTAPPGTVLARGPVGPTGPAGAGFIAGLSSDGSNGIAVTGNSTPNASIPKTSPMADIRANGAKIDGATDIGPALAASMAQCNVTNGSACTVLIPSGGPNGAYWANGTDGVTLANNVTLVLQGNLNLQTTLVTPNVNVNIIGSDGGNSAVQFAGPNQTASITVPSADNGVLGTAVTVTPTSGNFGVTQAFTPSTMAGLYANTWITIAGPLTCSITSLTRVSNLVTATLSSSCHIPPGVPVIVAGVTDSTFNGSHVGTGFGPFTMLTSDYVKNTMTWRQSGQADATSTGGTVTGLNEDTVENVQLSSCTSTTCTATFYRSHAATDLWGVDGVAMDAGAGGSHAQLLKGIAINAPGTALDTGGFNSQFNYVSANDVGQCSYKYYNFPVSALASSFMRFDSDAFNNFCGPWSIHEWNQWNYGVAAAGPLYINNSFLLRGVKLDHGGSDVYITNSTLDQNFAAISFDPNYYWNGNANNLVLNNDIFNDNPDGFPTVAVYQTVPVATNSPSGPALANISKVYGAMQATVNDNFPQVGGAGGPSLKNDTRLPNSTTTPKGIVGTYDDGRVKDGEIRGIGANFSPAVIPFATASVTVNPASWTGNCTVTTGVLGPDGTANAGGLVQNTSDLETFGVLSSLTPAVGDVILFGAWVYSPTAGVSATAQGTGSNVQVDNNGSAHFSFNNVAAGGFSSVGGSDSGIASDWYHPSVGMAVITSSDGTTGQVVNLRGGCDTVKTIDYFDPWMMYVPASAGIPLVELNRWRTQLMHGYVPPNVTAGTLGIDPNLTNLPWGGAKFPNVVAHVAATGQTAAVGLSSIYTATATGTYRLAWTTYMTTVATAGTINADATYNTGSGTVSTGFQGNTTATNLTSPGQVSVVMHVASGQNISFGTNFSGITGSPVYGYDVIVEQLQ